MTSKEIINQFKSLSNPKNIEGMRRFAVGGAKTLGISIPILRKLAKDVRKYHPERSEGSRDSSVASLPQNDRIRRHQLAQEIWGSGYHEARILASMIDEPSLVTEKQMDDWVADFDSWDVCDQVCMNLFDKTPFAFDKAIEWSSRECEFEKRAGFALMAVLAWHDKNASNDDLKQFLPIIIREATDDRNFVKKAVSWALRQIGKSRPSLRQPAINCAKKILNVHSEHRGARWIATDALRELEADRRRN